MKTAIVDGQEISAGAVAFELERLARFYASHGMTTEEIRRSLPELQDKALEQAIGAKLLLDQAARLDLSVTEADVDAEVARVVEQIGGEENYRKALAAQGLSEAAFRRELEKGARVNKLVGRACAHVSDPTEEEVVAFYEAHRAEYAADKKTIVDVHDQIRDLLRHAARGRAMDAYVADLREKAKIEYREAGKESK